MLKTDRAIPRTIIYIHKALKKNINEIKKQWQLRNTKAVTFFLFGRGLCRSSILLKAGPTSKFDKVPPSLIQSSSETLQGSYSFSRPWVPSSFSALRKPVMLMFLVATSPYPGAVHLRATMAKWEAARDSRRQPSLCPSSPASHCSHSWATTGCLWKFLPTGLLAENTIEQIKNVFFCCFIYCRPNLLSTNLLVIRKKDEAFLALWFLAGWLFLSTWMIFFHFLSRSGWRSVKYFYFFITLCVVKMSLLMKRTKSGIYHQILHLTDLA